MNKELEKYKLRIEKSPIFTLNKERDYSAFMSAQLQLIEDLYKYLMILNGSFYENYGSEIVEVAKSCMNSYLSNPDEFFNILLASVSRKCKQSFAKERAIQMRGGLHITELDNRLIIKITRYMKSKNITEMTDDHIVTIAGVLGISQEEVRELIQINTNAVTVSPVTIDEDGEETDLFDTLLKDDDIGEQLESKESVIALLNVIEETYDSLQDRQKPIISRLISAMLVKVLNNSSPEFVDLALHYDYFDKEVLKFSTPPTQRQIASEFNRAESSVSTTYKSFMDKLKAKLNPKGT